MTSFSGRRVGSGRSRLPATLVRKGSSMKKLLVLALAVVAGLFIWRKVQADREEQDLWTEATSAPDA